MKYKIIQTSIGVLAGLSILALSYFAQREVTALVLSGLIIKLLIDTQNERENR